MAVHLSTPHIRPPTGTYSLPPTTCDRTRNLAIPTSGRTPSTMSPPCNTHLIYRTVTPHEVALHPQSHTHGISTLHVTSAVSTLVVRPGHGARLANQDPPLMSALNHADTACHALPHPDYRSLGPAVTQYCIVIRLQGLVHVAVAKLLLGAGADANVVAGHYGTVLIAVSWTGHVEVAKLLLGAGADVNAAGGQYTTALITASAGGHVELAKLLLGAGADVNAAGGHYGTALISAYRSGHREVIKLLRERGAVS
ncbi:ankyrin [Athelia psychrophila]|uniref:Ankyrin n=1 Tax=Athelia psychrophila TaxID=1759441 RepID=A0A166J0M2_9AGAM|nr:ankyrin [Fibularhizoctonia sp. CBS 109695]